MDNLMEIVAKYAAPNIVNLNAAATGSLSLTQHHDIVLVNLGGINQADIFLPAAAICSGKRYIICNTGSWYSVLHIRPATTDQFVHKIPIIYLYGKKLIEIMSDGATDWWILHGVE